MLSGLPRTEIALYLVLWIGGVSVVLYKLYDKSAAIRATETRLITVSEGWVQDQTDGEWSWWTDTMMTYRLPLTPVYLLLSVLLRRYSSPVIGRLVTTAFSIGVVIVILGWRPCLFVIMLSEIMWMCSHSGDSRVVWAAFLCLSFTYQRIFYWQEALLHLHLTTYYQMVGFSVLASWTTLRSLSFCLDRLWYGVKTEAGDILEILAFVFYFPVINGPLITSQTYKLSGEKSCSLSLMDSGKRLLQLLFWAAVTELSTYFLYQQVISLTADNIESLDMWTAVAVGYCIAMFFCLKYVMFYGFPILVAQIDGVDAPSPPKCVTLVYLYSDMWRSFDVGLYIYIHRYVYTPFMSQQRSFLVKFGCSILCFSFVAVFHGVANGGVLVWSLLNWVGIVLEMVGNSIKKHGQYKVLKGYLRMSDVAERRLTGMLATPHLLMSCFSQYYFLRGVKVANSFVTRILLKSSGVELFVLLTFMYCGVQVAMEYERRRAEAAAKEKKNM